MKTKDKINFETCLENSYNSKMHSSTNQLCLLEMNAGKKKFEPTFPMCFPIHLLFT